MSDEFIKVTDKLEKKIEAIEAKKLDAIDAKLDKLSTTLVDELKIVHLMQDREMRLSTDIKDLKGVVENETSKLYKTTERLHQRIDEQEIKFSSISDIVKASETRNRTISAVLSIVWLVISGVAGWAFKTSEEKVKEYASKVEQLEKISSDLKRDQESKAPDVSQIAGIKRRVENIENQIDNLHAK